MPYQLRLGVEMIRKLQAMADALTAFGGTSLPVLVVSAPAYDILCMAFEASAASFPLSKLVTHGVASLYLKTARSQILIMKEKLDGQEVKDSGVSATKPDGA